MSRPRVAGLRVGWRIHFAKRSQRLLCLQRAIPRRSPEMTHLGSATVTHTKNRICRGASARGALSSTPKACKLLTFQGRRRQHAAENVRPALGARQTRCLLSSRRGALFVSKPGSFLASAEGRLSFNARGGAKGTRNQLRIVLVLLLAKLKITPGSAASSHRRAINGCSWNPDGLRRLEPSDSRSEQPSPILPTQSHAQSQRIAPEATQG